MTFGIVIEAPLYLWIGETKMIPINPLIFWWLSLTLGIIVCGMITR